MILSATLQPFLLKPIHITSDILIDRPDMFQHYFTEYIFTDKHIIWVYYMSYWNNRRICSSIGGIPPAMKRKRYFAESAKAVG